MIVETLVVAHDYSDIVSEYRSCEVAERLWLLRVEALESALQYAVQAVWLHLFFQVFPVPVEVLVVKYSIMQAKQNLA